MTPEQVGLLEASIDRVVDITMLDGTRLLATPLVVYTGEDNPDVFVLPVNRCEGALVVAKTGQSILLADIAGITLMQTEPPPL